MKEKRGNAGVPDTNKAFPYNQLSPPATGVCARGEARLQGGREDPFGTWLIHHLPLVAILLDNMNNTSYVEV
ncbi:hypothetical protein FACS1894110_19820 [Spirochaetia bacterium]|nr:hypothetical protein FACS1894110_19820 [Spirochaetia bacterium]